MQLLLPAAVDWTLIAYALVMLAGIWSFAVQRIESDYRSTLEAEREHLRSVSATLEAHVEAMLGDGVGAALAAAVILEVEDAGHGILAGGPPGRMADVTALGVGLAGMRERMRQLGGELCVSTGPRGTCVQAKLALTRNAGASTDRLASL